MRACVRCGDNMVVYVVEQRYCAACAREIAALDARSRFGVVKDGEIVPTWRRVSMAKVLTGGGAA